MFKIGEFSKLTQVSIRMLRYYDEVGLMKPAEIDKWTGYRMYSVEQIPVLNKIVYLRDSGFHVSEITEILVKQDDQLLTKYLDAKCSEIKKRIQDEQKQLQQIKLAKKEILEYKNEMHYNILIKSIPSYQVISLRRVIPDYYAEGDLWLELSAFTSENRFQILGNLFSIYHDLEYKETNVDVELCAPIKTFRKSTGDFICYNTEPIPIMACTMVYGDFSNIADAYRVFADWLQKNTQYRMFGKTRQIIHRGPWNEDNPKKYLIELQIPLRIL